MIRKLLAALFAHPQVGPRLIQRLSETYPIRRAARFTAYLYLRGKQAIEEGISAQAGKTSTLPPPQGQQINFNRFKERFSAELKKGLEEAKDDMKRRKY